MTTAGKRGESRIARFDGCADGRTPLPVHEGAGRRAPQVTGQVTGQATGQVTPSESEPIQRLVSVLKGEMSRSALQEELGLAHRDHFTSAYLQPSLEAGFVEMTIPDKPKSSKQRYRLTAAGEALRAHLAALLQEGSPDGKGGKT